MTEQMSSSPRVGSGCTGFTHWLAVDRVLELVAAFTVAASLIGLVAALAGVFHAPQVLLGSLIVTGIYGFKTRGHGMFPASTPPRWAHLVLLVLVALFFRLPAYHYVLGGQDEGLYTNIAQHIDYTGGIAVHDLVAEKLENSPYLHQYLRDNRLVGHPGMYLAGVYARNAGNTKKLDFQFYDVFPVWMALVGGVFGSMASIYALTFFALLSIIFFYRIALLLTQSHRAALVAGGLLALNPLHAFFSKFPVTEMPTIAFSLIGFTLLAAYWSTDASERQQRWLWLSVLTFLCLFTTRISGFMYVPFFIIMAMTALICNKDPGQRHAMQVWTAGTVFVYVVSVVYGLVWSHSYSHDIYDLSFGPMFGVHWKAILAILASAGLLLWLGCRILSAYARWRERVALRVIRPADRWLGLIVLAALVLGLLKIYWLGWTNHYAASVLDQYFHLSGHGLRSASASSLWALCVFLGPPMVFAFLILIGRSQADPRLGFLRLFLIGFFVFAAVLQWALPYSPYFARYLLSELVPYLILFVVCVWSTVQARKARALLSLALVFSLVYSTAISAMQIGKNENEGAYAALARLTTPVDPDDVILLDTLRRSPDTSLVKTPLVYTFHRDVVTVGSEALSNSGYLAELHSLYNDVFLISAAPSAPAGFTQIDSVRFQPLTYKHNHSFPRKLVAQADVVLYLYRLDNPQVPLGNALSFANGQPWGNWLQSGWSAPESWGVWTSAKHAVLAIDPRQFPAGALNLVLHIKTVPFVTPNHPRQHIEVSINGNRVADYEANYPETSLSMTIPVSSTAWIDRRKLSVGFMLPDAASPKSLGRGGDARQLAMGLVSMTVTAAGTGGPRATDKQ